MLTMESLRRVFAVRLAGIDIFRHVSTVAGEKPLLAAAT